MHADKLIAHKMKEEEKWEHGTLRILLLSPEVSEKMAIMKQICKTHDGIISEREKHGLIEPIREAVIKSMTILCTKSLELSQHQEHKDTDVGEENKELRQEFASLSFSGPRRITLTLEMIDKIKQLWSDVCLLSLCSLSSLSVCDFV